MELRTFGPCASTDALAELVAGSVCWGPLRATEELLCDSGGEPLVYLARSGGRESVLVFDAGSVRHTSDRPYPHQLEQDFFRLVFPSPEAAKASLCEEGLPTQRTLMDARAWTQITYGWIMYGDRERGDHSVTIKEHDVAVSVDLERVREYLRQLALVHEDD